MSSLTSCTLLSTILTSSNPKDLAQLDQKLRILLRASFPFAASSSAKSSSPPPCSSCSKSSNATERPYYCLTCALPFCRSHTGGHSHHLFLDIRSQSIFCTSPNCCSNDYVYSERTERVFESERVIQEERAWVAASTSASTSSKKEGGEKRVPFVPTIPIKNPTPGTPAAKTRGGGLSPFPRGLRNLGQTCYMSVILQTLLYNPLLRSFYLGSAGHNRFLCPSSSAGGGKGCLACELDRLFEEGYNGEITAFGPTNFLYTIWANCTEISGYAQQDSHEFLISLLNLLHTSLSPSPSSSTSSCSCPIHQTFSGVLSSQVACGKCGNLTNSDDPFLDLSLDLKNIKLGAVGTLEGCLKRFTSEEELGEKEYSCERCGENQMKARKRLSIKKLPPVLCIQLKRFEHTNGSHKIDIPISFPSQLNMRSFTTGTIAKPQDKWSNDGLDSIYEYELSAVVCHEGQINNGHYTNFCMTGDEFYCFDDDKVRKAALGEVLASKAYLLTYVKKTLGYTK